MLKLYRPVKAEIDQNNLFGTPSPMYLALGQKGHPGLDFEAKEGTPVFAPCDGDAFYVTDKDGGCGLWIRTPSNAEPAYNIILWHMPPEGTPEYPYSIPTDKVTPVKAGQMLGYSGNSGYPIESTGPHLHLGVMPCDFTGEAIDHTNGYLGCVDPMPYLSSAFAEDIGKIASVVEVSASVTAQLVDSNEITVSQKQSFLDSLAKAFSDFLAYLQK